MPTHDRTAGGGDGTPGRDPAGDSAGDPAAAAVGHLAGYFAAFTPAGPGAAPDPRAALDAVLYGYLRQTIIPGAVYLAFRQWPRDRRMREAVTTALREELAADAGFAAAVATALADVAAAEAAARTAASAEAAAESATPQELASGGAGPVTGPATDPAAPAPSAPLEPAAPAAPAASPPPTHPADHTGAGTDDHLTAPHRTSPWLAASAATLLFAAAGTGMTVASISSAAGGPGHYTFADDPSTNPLDDFTVFDWTTDANGTVSGVFQAVDPADHTNDFTQHFTGHQEGRTLTFVVAATAETPKSTLRGTVTSSTLVFQPPLSSSAQAQPVYRKTTMAAFTKAVHDFETRHPGAGNAA